MAPASQAQTPQHDFNIPAENAASALQDYAVQAQTQVLFPYDAAAAHSAPAIRGRLSDAEVLTRLARAARLRIVFRDSQSVTLAEGQSRPPSPARAAPAPAVAADDALSPVIVTGTHLRGLQPTGEHVVQIGRSDIDRTPALSVSQALLTLAPQINGFGAASQAVSGFEPRLRSLGGSSSSSTLVLLDGRRIAPGSNASTFASDPDVVALGAVDHVDILADGASALYGSDAVAGVINVVTRKSFDGVQLTGQAGFGDAYWTRSVDLVLGRAKDRLSVFAAYDFTNRSDLFAGNRSFVSGNQSSRGPGATGRGGANFNTFACAPATIAPGAGQPGAGLVFQAPYAGDGLPNTAAIYGLCSNSRQGDVLPSDAAHRAYLSARGDLGRVQISAALLFSSRTSSLRIPRGTLSYATVYGPGSTPPAGPGQINPFFAGPSGVSSGAVSYDFQSMFGPGALTRSLQQTTLAIATADIALTPLWSLSASASVGRQHTTTTTTGTVCIPCADLALNGTSSLSGTPTYVQAWFGSVTGRTQLPLTPANALDIWSPDGGATSEAVRNQLLDNRSYNEINRPMADLKAQVEGPLARTPAGDVRAAVGAEYYAGGGSGSSTAPGAVGPASLYGVSSGFRFADRLVASAFGEMRVPLVGDDMAVPWVRRLALNLSGRIDHYSDVVQGADLAANPRLTMDWAVTGALTLRASYGASFTAPQLGHNEFVSGTSTIRDYFSTGGPAFQLPQGYPGAASLGCPASGPCTITALSGIDGIVTFGANPDLKPQIGRTWSLGADLGHPSLLPGLKASLTYWGAGYRGLITNIMTINQAVATPGISPVFFIDPTPDQVALYTHGRNQVTPITLPIRFLFNTTQTNMFDLRAQGLDFDLAYALDSDLGRFLFSGVGSAKLQFDTRTQSGRWTRALGIGNATNTVSPIPFAGRFGIGWSRAGWDLDLFANILSGYDLIDTTQPFSSSPCPPNVTISGYGCQSASPNLTFDLHLERRFPRGVAAALDVTNLFDSGPPWIDSPDSITASNSLNVWANPIGRVATVRLQKRW